MHRSPTGLSAQIILLSLAASMFAWVMSAVLDFYLHYWDRTFPELLFADVPTREIFSRVAISIAFLISGTVSSVMVQRLDAAERGERRLNESLKAVRSVNQLITRERNLKALAQGVCDRLVGMRAYHSAEVTLAGRWALRTGTSREDAPPCSELTTIEMPLWCTDDASGELSVTLPAASGADVEEHEFLREVAEDLAFSLRSLALEEERERAAAAQRTVYQMSSALNSRGAGGDLESVAQYGLSGALGTSCIKLVEHDPETGCMAPWCSGRDGREDEPMVRAEGSLHGCVARTGIVLLVDRTQIERMATEGVVAGLPETPPASWAGVPVLAGGRVRAVLSAEHATDPKCLGPAEVELLKFVAEQLGHSIERMQADRQLREQREQLQTILDSVPAYIFYKDADGRYLSVNRALAEITGIPKESWVGKRIEEVLPGVGEGASFRDLEVVRNGTPSIGDIEVLELPSGMRWLETDRIPYRDPKGKIVGVIGLSIDVTDHRKAEAALAVKEEELRQSQKMEAIGLLAGGIAHDFNNLLTAISGYVELSLPQLDGSGPVAQNLKGVQEASSRAAALTRQLLVFSRRQPLELVQADLGEIAATARGLLTRLIGEDVELELTAGAGLPPVCVDRGQIEQVIINLAVNARDAMPEGGRLTITTERVVFGDAADRTGGGRQGAFAKLVIADTGVGMSREVMQHIFEPFFTTKGPHAGTGLGLSVVYGIVEQHGGWIDVASEPGAGTVFSIFLPESKDAVRPLEAVVRPAADAQPGNGQQILVVEDEDAIRRLAAVALKRGGYRVTEAGSAEEALAKLEGDDFSLLFSDVVLPGMNGVRLADAVLTRRPDLRVLLCSGYADGKAQWSLIKERRLNFLDKPYTIEGLLDAIRRALHEDPQGGRAVT